MVLLLSLIEFEDVFYMAELEVYANRLVKLGYNQSDAIRIVGSYVANNNLDALEDFIHAKETIQEVG